MEEVVFMGYRFYSFTDQRGMKQEGYTLYLLQPVEKGDNNNGFMPVTYYDRFNNRQKFPSVSADDFKRFCLDKVKVSQKIKILFNRNNKIAEVNLGGA